MGSYGQSTKLSEELGAPLPLPSPIVFDLLSSSSSANSTRIALVCMHQAAGFLSTITSVEGESLKPNASPYLSWSFTELNHASHVLAASLVESGIKPGMTFMVLINNCAEFHIMFWAALELNCIFSPIATKAAGNKQEMEHLLEMISPSVLLVQESDIVSKLSLISPALMSNIKLKLFSPLTKEATPTGWKDFATFCENGLSHAAETNLHSLAVQRNETDIILLLTTSGTTSLPKGCPHTNKSFGSGMLSWQAHAKLAIDDSTLTHMPLSHIMGLLSAYTFQATGLKTVHAAPTFTPASTLAAIRLERITYLLGIPAMIYALLAHPDFRKEDMSCVRYTAMGAATVSPEVLRLTIDTLGSEKAYAGFGMTECGPIILHPNSDKIRSVPTIVTCGTVMAGAKARVCRPDADGIEIVVRGTPGELHISSDQVIEGYWLGKSQSKAGNDVFYNDSQGHWLKTGDRAIMHDNGEVEIVGRYKDMIIRGGENISPAAIEAMLLSRFGLAADVIGIPDEIAGEIPLAIIKRRPGQEVNVLKVRETLVKELGAAWVPEEILDIETFEVEDFPRTSSGKVQKNVLRELVLKIRQAKETSSTSAGDQDDMLQTLLKIWTDLLKVSPGTLTPSTSVNDWADSLILARFSRVLHRQTGLQMNIQELTAHPIIEAQARLLSNRETKNGISKQTVQILPTHSGPPSMDDMVHVLGDPERFTRTKEIAKTTLAPLGLNWNDVEDVIPMGPMQEFYIEYRRPQSNNHRHALVCAGTSVSQLLTALETALASHPMLRTMAVTFDPDTQLHLSIRPSPAWVFNCITVLPAIASRAELSALAYNDPVLDFAAPPGPLFRMILTHIDAENSAALVYQAHHSVFDALSLPLFLADLNTLLLTPNVSLTPHVPFKAWADHIYAFSSSTSALASIKWHTNRLTGISLNPTAFFPPQRAPEWFKGHSASWIDTFTSLPGPLRPSVDAHPIGVLGIKASTSLPSLHTLKAVHSIDGSQVLRAALATMVTRRTGAGYAMFGQSQAGRNWPFLADWQAERMPNAMELPGPCVQGALNRIEVNNSDTVLALLTTLQNEQMLLTKHAHVPTRQLVAALNFNTKKGLNTTNEGKGDGDVMRDMFRRMIFNWLPVEPEFGFEKLDVVQVESRTDCGLLWNCVMLDRETVQIHPTWDDAQLGRSEVEEMLKEVLWIAKGFATEDNWGRKVGEVV